MTQWRMSLPLLLMALAGCSGAPAANPDQPDAYALHLPVTPAQGNSIQRIALPAQALVAVQREDVGDIRLFDAQGRRMALALADNASLVGRRTFAVPLFPVTGPSGVTGQQDLHIRIANGTAVRVVTVDSTVPREEGTASPLSSAALLDTRAIAQPAQAIVLDATIPSGRPVTLTLQSSANLRDWQPLAETTLFRPEGSDKILGDGRLSLDAVDLAGRYVVVRWQGSDSVAVRAASVETAAIPLAPSVEVEATAPVLDTPHQLRFALPATAPIDGIRLRQSAKDGVLPLRLFGRANAEQPWRLMSAATLRSGESGVLLTGLSPTMRQFKVEADQRTAGWSAPPRLSLRFRPVTLIADLSANPPYRLSVGQAQAAPSYLDMRALVPDPRASLTTLPAARVDGTGQPPPIVMLVAPDADGPLAPRKLALWGALLIGTALLGFVAWRLAKGLPAQRVDQA